MTFDVIHMFSMCVHLFVREYIDGNARPRGILCSFSFLFFLFFLLQTHLAMFTINRFFVVLSLYIFFILFNILLYYYIFISISDRERVSSCWPTHWWSLSAQLAFTKYVTQKPKLKEPHWVLIYSFSCANASIVIDIVERRKRTNKRSFHFTIIKGQSIEN